MIIRSLFCAAFTMLAAQAAVFAASTSKNVAITVTNSGGGGTAPEIIQYVASSADPCCGNTGIPGNNFKIPWHNVLQDGDTLICGITYTSGVTPTFGDTLSGVTWVQAGTTTDPGPGTNASRIYIAAVPSGGGADVTTVGFGTTVQPFQFTCGEFNNVATSSPVNGTRMATALRPSPVIDPGSFTPGNNDANGGNLIWTYVSFATPNASSNPTSWSPGANFTLLDADIAWISRTGQPHASQWYVQPAAAAIDPVMASNGDTVDQYNSLTVALRVASAGSPIPSGIHVNKILHFSGGTATTTNWRLQTPVTGNLRVLTLPSNGNATSITDTDGSSWSCVAGIGGTQMCYAANTAANSNLIITANGTQAQPSVRFYDVQGAAAAPFDVDASAQDTCSSTNSVNNEPTISPTTTNGLVIARMGIGQGPGLGLASGAPTGAVFILTTYSGETDFDSMENADAEGIFYNPTTAAENWNWRITNTPNPGCDSLAIAFKHG